MCIEGSSPPKGTPVSKPVRSSERQANSCNDLASVISFSSVSKSRQIGTQSIDQSSSESTLQDQQQQPHNTDFSFLMNATNQDSLTRNLRNKLETPPTFDHQKQTGTTAETNSSTCGINHQQSQFSIQTPFGKVYDPETNIMRQPSPKVNKAK